MSKEAKAGQLAAHRFYSKRATHLRASNPTSPNRIAAHLSARHSKRDPMKLFAFAIALIAICVSSSHAQPTGPLTLSRTIVLTGVTGRFDHLAIDTLGCRLFIAATGNHSVEVINLKTDKAQQSITGLGKPHGLAWVATTGSLYVADGSLAELRVYKGSPLVLAGTIKLSDDADDMVYDEAAHLLFVGHGGSGAATPALVAVVDTDKFLLLENLSVANHPEALEIDSTSNRIFVNVADSSEVAVIDASSKAIAAHWKLTKAAQNVPLAFDDDQRLIFLACRTPGTVIAIDASTGKELASLPTAAGADDLFYDPALRRVYVIAGSGEVDAYQVDGAKNLHALGALKTAAGAKTGLFVPVQNLLYVGVPEAGADAASIRVYKTAASGALTPAVATIQR
jgi:DNA-binding beta-propeller fold protein YncE